jgi:hypothetical protein
VGLLLIQPREGIRPHMTRLNKMPRFLPNRKLVIPMRAIVVPRLSVLSGKVCASSFNRPILLNSASIYSVQHKNSARMSTQAPHPLVMIPGIDFYTNPSLKIFSMLTP